MNKPRWLPHHEYWPSWTLYGPVFAEYLLTAVRRRSLRYPLLVNEGIPLAGLVGESKWEILQKLPPGSYPETRRILPGSSEPAGWTFPLVAKPDEGERGFGVCFLSNPEELAEYHRLAPRPYLLQKFVASPFEAGIFFIRSGGKLSISSLGVKCLASVVGDGKSTLREICQRDGRYSRQITRLQQMAPALGWEEVVPEGQTVTLDEIRNHRRGARFEDGRHLVTPQLERMVDALIPESSGINYGRADIRCPSEAHLLRGEGIQIIEVNGLTGEPAEIYDPNMTLKESLRILRLHWRIVAQLAAYEESRGRKPPPWAIVFRELIRWRVRDRFAYS